jgi:hypothetical protein
MPFTSDRDVDATLEDLAFLADTGVGLSDAAERTAFSNRGHLDKWLRRHSEHQLLARLLDQDRRVA